MTNTTQVRRFQWRDLERFVHLFNEVSGISNSEKAYDMEFMLQFLSQPHCDPEENCYLVEEDGCLTGYILITQELAIGRVVASIGVVSYSSSQDSELNLVRIAKHHAKTLKATVLHIEAPSDKASTHRILKIEGFRAVKSYWKMRRDRGEVEAMVFPKELTLRSFRLGQDEKALTDLQNAAFEHNWGFCPNTVEEIYARVRLSRSDPEGIILVSDSDRLAAYNWTTWVSNGTSTAGWISMTGVHPDYRGQGLGKAALISGIRYLTKRDVSCIELEVDSDNKPAKGMYVKLGFRKFLETTWFENQLNYSS